MDFTQYQQIQIVQFLGLWNRGSKDDIPNDHASDLQNLRFTNRKEIITRYGTDISFASGRNVVRSRMATFDNKTLIMLTCDGAGHIYREDTGAVLLTVPNMVDFEILNVYNRVLIAPVLSAFSATNYIYVWTTPSATPRPIAAPRPDLTLSGGLTATNDSVAGFVNAGAHCFTVAYVTDTGFVTHPGTNLGGGGYACVTAPGLQKIWVTNIPNSSSPGFPSYVTARWLLMTKSDQSEFFYVPNPTSPSLPTLNDTTTNNFIVNVADPNLVISADSLFDLAESVISGVGSVGLTQYRNRVFVIGGGTNGDSLVNDGDTINVSQPNTFESFDQVAGNLYIPSQHDGNVARCASELFGVLYVMKSVGIFSTQDNGSDPYTWNVMMVDGSVGCYPKGLASITGSQNSLGIQSTIVLGDREGIFLFNGNVIKPELTYKIKTTWNQLSDPSQVRIAIDPFAEQMYVLLPTASGNIFLVADYAAGLDPQAVRWTVYKFPWNINDVIMANIQDSSDYNYWPRLGTNTGLVKITSAKTNDYGGAAVTNYWQTGMLAPNLGTVNVYRYIRWRLNGSGTLSPTLMDENFGNAKAAFAFAMGSGNRDQSIQINFVNEQMALKFSTTGTMNVSRLELFSKPQYFSRPTV